MSYSIEGDLEIVSLVDGNEESGEIMCLRYCPLGKILAVGYKNGSIKLYHKAGELQGELKLENTPKKFPVTSIKFLNINDNQETDDFCYSQYVDDNFAIECGLLMASYASGVVAFWHYLSKSLLSIIDEKRPSSETTNLAVSHDNQVLVSVGADPSIHVYDLTSKKTIRVLQALDEMVGIGEGQRKRFFGVSFHPLDHNVFVTGGWDKLLRFWDLRVHKSTGSIFGPHVCGEAIDFDKKGENILTASWRRDESLQVWNYETKNMILVSDNIQKSMLYTGQWYGAYGILCGGSNQNMIRLIDKFTHNTIGLVSDLPHGVFCVDNDRIHPRPKISFGSGTKLYTIRCTGVPKFPVE